ncbi:AhpA/YtjB family protein [Pseudoalteromonas sp.]|uniref:AhpA/YtjB family protein n=1 Tax=Pseudoalteromonas sp. TaxID=53249 RepID=UPI00356A49DF
MKKNQDRNPAFASTYQRISRLMIAAICLIALTHIGFNTSFKGHQVLNNQSKATAKGLAKQLALGARFAIKGADNKMLNRLVNNFAQDEFIQTAAIFDKQGNLLAQSNFAASYQDLLETPSALPGLSKLATPVISDVFDQGKRIGFVRLTYTFPAAIREGHEYLHQVTKQIALMLILSVILTWVLARKVKRWQVKRYIRNTEQEEA